MPDITAREAIEICMKSAGRHKLYNMYREYYEGAHRTQLTQRQREYLQVGHDIEFNDNYIPVVVDALSERLAVTGFKCDGQGETLWQWWEQNRGDALQAVVHSRVVLDGDDYVLVEWDEETGSPRWTFEHAFDGSEGAEVVYSDDGYNKPLFAWKRWKSGDRQRINIYFDNRVEKFEQSGSGDWATIEAPVYWTDTGTEFGSPLGLPMIHFRNRDQGYSYGRSEVADVIPLQNGLNKAIIDLIAAADTSAFRVFFVIGDDPAGLKVYPGAIVYTKKSRSDADIGAIDGEDLSPMIAFKDAFVAEIARVSRTPLSYFQMSGQVAAEGTMKQQESGLVSRAKDRQVTFGNAWEDVLYLSRRLYNVFGTDGKQLDETANISTVWKDPETRNDAAFIEMLRTKRDLNVPVATLWSEMGYQADEIEIFLTSPENAIFMMTKAAEMWQYIKNASGEMIPVETILEAIGFDAEMMKRFGTQRLAAIRLQQEDTIPKVSL